MFHGIAALCPMNHPKFCLCSVRGSCFSAELYVLCLRFVNGELELSRKKPSPDENLFIVSFYFLSTGDYISSYDVNDIYFFTYFQVFVLLNLELTSKCSNKHDSS